MTRFDSWLETQLARIREQGLHRFLRHVEPEGSTGLRFAGRRVRNFAGNDYLGLARHPEVLRAASEAVTCRGGGAGASRLLSGTFGSHRELEQELARFKGTAAALVFSSGYAAALGAIPALVGPGDVVIVDKKAHACIVDAARLSGATLRVFRHNDPADLERLLRWAASPGGDRRILVATESVFSMDGDLAPLEEIVALKERYGAWLLLDEAHATGLYGECHRGLVEATGQGGRIEVQMATLGKALGSAGGAICGSARLIEFLVNRARSFIFSTAPPPAMTAAATAAIRLLATPDGDERVARLWQNVDTLRARFAAMGLQVPADRSPILPVTVGDEARAVTVGNRMIAAGFFVPAVRFPAVPRGQARLRITVSAAHTDADLAALAQALRTTLSDDPIS